MAEQDLIVAEQDLIGCRRCSVRYVGALSQRCVGAMCMNRGCDGMVENLTHLVAELGRQLDGAAWIMLADRG